MDSPSFLRRRLWQPIQGLLRQGLTPQKIALGLTVGILLGVFPVLGSTTILCAVAAYGLGINLPAIQLVNYLVYPLQIALLLPFIRLGEWVFGAPRMPLSATEIRDLLRADASAAMAVLWTATWHAIVAWAIVSAALFVALYRSLLALVRGLLDGRASETSQQGGDPAA